MTNDTHSRSSELLEQFMAALNVIAEACGQPPIGAPVQISRAHLPGMFIMNNLERAIGSFDTGVHGELLTVPPERYELIAAQLGADDSSTTSPAGTSFRLAPWVEELLDFLEHGAPPEAFYDLPNMIGVRG